MRQVLSRAFARAGCVEPGVGAVGLFLRFGFVETGMRLPQTFFLGTLDRPNAEP